MLLHKVNKKLTKMKLYVIGTKEHDAGSINTPNNDKKKTKKSNNK